MKCKEIKILLSAGIDGELTASEKFALDQHVSSCAECARDKAQFARLGEVMPFWADAEPSPWLAEKFSYKLAERQECGAERVPKRRVRWGTLSAATAGFAAAILMIGLLIHSNVPQAPMQAKVQPQTKAIQPRLETKRMTGNLSVPEPIPTQRIRHRGTKPVVRHIPRANHPQPEASVAAMPTPPSAPMAATTRDYPLPGGAVTILAKSTFSENLGEASLAMNDTIERVRGNLQKSVDLMISQPPVPVTDSTHTNGGTP